MDGTLGLSHGDSTTLDLSQGDSEADSTSYQIAVCLEEGWWVPPDCWMWFTWWLEGWWWCKLWLLWSPAEHFGFVVECVISSKNNSFPCSLPNQPSSVDGQKIICFCKK